MGCKLILSFALGVVPALFLALPYLPPLLLSWLNSLASTPVGCAGGQPQDVEVMTYSEFQRAKITLDQIDAPILIRGAPEAITGTLKSAEGLRTLLRNGTDGTALWSVKRRPRSAGGEFRPWTPDAAWLQLGEQTESRLAAGRGFEWIDDLDSNAFVDQLRASSAPGSSDDFLYALLPLADFAGGGTLQEPLLDVARSLLPEESDRQPLPRASAFVSSAGSVAGTHRDSLWNVYAQGFGTKHWLLFPPEAATALYPHSLLHPGAQTSQMDGLAALIGEGSAPAPHAGHWPLAGGGLPGALRATLAPGDLIVVPPHWWHTVATDAAGPSVSIYTAIPEPDLPWEVYGAIGVPLPPGATAAEAAVGLRALVRELLSATEAAGANASARDPATEALRYLQQTRYRAYTRGVEAASFGRGWSGAAGHAALRAPLPFPHEVERPPEPSAFRGSMSAFAAEVVGVCEAELSRAKAANLVAGAQRVNAVLGPGGRLLAPRGAKDRRSDLAKHLGNFLLSVAPPLRGVEPAELRRETALDFIELIVAASVGPAGAQPFLSTCTDALDLL